MGWVWKEDDDDGRSSDVINKFDNTNPRSDGQCSTRKIVSSQCRTEEVEPGKFIKKCEKTERLLKDCIGRPTEVVQSNKEYTEEDVTEQVMKGSSPMGMGSFEVGPFDFPGLRSDIEAIERSFFGSVNRFFEAAEDVKNGFFSVFGSPYVYDEEFKSIPPPTPRRGIPIEPRPSKEASSPKTQPENSDGRVDISGLARDV